MMFLDYIVHISVEFALCVAIGCILHTCQMQNTSYMVINVCSNAFADASIHLY